MLRDLAASAAALAERLGVIRHQDIDITWARFGSGDVGAFVRPFLTYAVSHPEIGDRLAEAAARDPVVAAALQSYVRRFERLTAVLDDKLVRDVLEEGRARQCAFRLFKPAATAVTRARNWRRLRPQTDGDVLVAELAALSERLEASAPR